MSDFISKFKCKYILKETFFDPSKKKPPLYIGEFIKIIHTNLIEMVFKDAKIPLKITIQQYKDLEDKSSISQSIPLNDADEFEFNRLQFNRLQFNKEYTSNSIKIIFGDNTESTDKEIINYLLEKNKQDAYTTAGYTRCLNVDDHKSINKQLEKGIDKNDMKEVNKHCGAIFNRRPRNCTNVYTQDLEESFLRNEENFGKLPQGIKKHEAASLKESNGILLKGLSFILRLKDIDTQQDPEKRDKLFIEFLKHNLDLNHITKNRYDYILKYHTSTIFSTDFLTHKTINIKDIGFISSTLITYNAF